MSVEPEDWQEMLEALESAQQGKVLDGDVIHAWLESWGDDNELSPPKL